MAIRSCSECRIQRQKECKWVNERNMAKIGECVTNLNWGGACATCGKGNGDNPGGLDVCRGCLVNTRKGTTYFIAWSKRVI